MTGATERVCVSVVMATHNGERYLRESLESMAAQRFTDWEWVIVDDGSTDGTGAILADFEKRYGDRMHLVRNDERRGLTVSLNRGLAQAKGAYVARMDDDDIAHPDRLARQVKAMEANEDLLMTGTAGYRLDEAGGETRPFMPDFAPLFLRIALCWFNPFMHASVMFRRVLRNGEPVLYDEAYRTAQDYALWTRLAERGRIEIIPERLMTNRYRADGVTGSKRTEQLEATRRVSERYTEGFLRDTPLAGMSPGEIRDLIDDRAIPDPIRLRSVKQLFDAAMRLPGTLPRDRRDAFAAWAEPLLSMEKFMSLFTGSSGRLLASCGRKMPAYLIRRVFA